MMQPSSSGGAANNGLPQIANTSNKNFFQNPNNEINKPSSN